MSIRERFDRALRDVRFCLTPDYRAVAVLLPTECIAIYHRDDEHVVAGRDSYLLSRRTILHAVYLPSHVRVAMAALAKRRPQETPD